MGGRPSNARQEEAPIDVQQSPPFIPTQGSGVNRQGPSSPEVERPHPMAHEGDPSLTLGARDPNLTPGARDPNLTSEAAIFKYWYKKGPWDADKKCILK